MLSSYTSFEEDNIPYIRIVAQIIRNNGEGPKLFEDTANKHACFENIIPRLQSSSGLLSLWRSSSKACADEFYYSFYLV